MTPLPLQESPAPVGGVRYSGIDILALALRVLLGRLTVYSGTSTTLLRRPPVSLLVYTVKIVCESEDKIISDC